MIETAPRTLPRDGLPERPSWLVRFVEAAASSALADSRSRAWPDLLARACDEVLALIAQTSRNRSSICDPKVAKHLGELRRQSPSVELNTALAGELLGTMVRKVPASSQSDDLHRSAYPGLWDLALNEYASDPDLPGEPDQILYDHGTPLTSARGTQPPWPTGLNYACTRIMEFAHEVTAYCSLGLGLAHIAPGPVVWPPPDAPLDLLEARHELKIALSNAPLNLDEHTARLFACLAARDNPDLPDPTVAEIDQVNASLRDWDESVIPAAVELATATYSHAWEWASPDPDCWSLDAVFYAYAESCLSIHHLRRATDTLCLTDVAARGHAWWWCHDRELDVASLREIVGAW